MSEGNDSGVTRAYCDRCGTVGGHLVVIQANHQGALKNQKPLCDDCLRTLGEWFQHEYAMIPVSEVWELIQEWETRGVEEPYGMTWLPPAEELRELVEDHADE